MPVGSKFAVPSGSTAFSDTTNSFKAYRRVLLDRIHLTSKGFEIFLEMHIKAMMLASRVDEIDVSRPVRKKKQPKLSVTKDGYSRPGTESAGPSDDEYGKRKRRGVTDSESKSSGFGAVPLAPRLAHLLVC